MAPPHTEHRSNEQTAGETGCPFRMNVPAQRTNGWRSRVPLPDERAQRTLRLSERAGDTQLTAVLWPSSGRQEVRGGALSCTPTHPLAKVTTLGEFQLRHGEADNKEKEKIPQGQPVTTLRNFVRQIFRWWAEGRQSQHPTTDLFGRY